MFTEGCFHGDSKVYQVGNEGETPPSAFVVLGSPPWLFQRFFTFSSWYWWLKDFSISAWFLSILGHYLLQVSSLEPFLHLPPQDIFLLSCKTYCFCGIFQRLWGLDCFPDVPWHPLLSSSDSSSSAISKGYSGIQVSATPKLEDHRAVLSEGSSCWCNVFAVAGVTSLPMTASPGAAQIIDSHIDSSDNADGGHQQVFLWQPRSQTSTRSLP